MADWDLHIEISRSFRDQGVVEIETRDLLQGSEKLWGTVAHAVKAVAERRNWGNMPRTGTRSPWSTG